MAEYLASIFGTEKDKYVSGIYAYNIVHTVVCQLTVFKEFLAC